MKSIIIASIVGVMVLGSSSVSGEELVPVGLQKQLLVDDYVISVKQNITRELGKPKKLGVVMKPDTPTDFDLVKKFPEGLPTEGGSDLSRLQGKTVKLKFTLKNAILYAFEINKE